MSVTNMSYDTLIKEITNLNINDLFELPRSLKENQRNLIILAYELYHEDFLEENWYRIITDMLEINLADLDYFLSKLDLGVLLKIKPDNFKRILSKIMEDKLPLFKSSITNAKLITVNHLSKYTKPNVDILLDYINN